MNTALWILQGTLAAIFLIAGLKKLLQPKEKLETKMGWVNDFDARSVKTIGLLEILAGLGLILPGVLQTAPQVTVSARDRSGRPDDRCRRHPHPAQGTAHDRPHSDPGDSRRSDRLGTPRPLHALKDQSITTDQAAASSPLRSLTIHPAIPTTDEGADCVQPRSPVHQSRCGRTGA